MCFITLKTATPPEIHLKIAKIFKNIGTFSPIFSSKSVKG